MRRQKKGGPRRRVVDGLSLGESITLTASPDFPLQAIASDSLTLGESDGQSVAVPSALDASVSDAVTLGEADTVTVEVVALLAAIDLSLDQSAPVVFDDWTVTDTAGRWVVASGELIQDSDGSDTNPMMASDSAYAAAGLALTMTAHVDASGAQVYHGFAAANNTLIDAGPYHTTSSNALYIRNDSGTNILASNTLNVGETYTTYVIMCGSNRMHLLIEGDDFPSLTRLAVVKYEPGGNLYGVVNSRRATLRRRLLRLERWTTWVSDFAAADNHVASPSTGTSYDLGDNEGFNYIEWTPASNDVLELRFLQNSGGTQYYKVECDQANSTIKVLKDDATQRGSTASFTWTVSTTYHVGVRWIDDGGTIRTQITVDNSQKLNPSWGQDYSNTYVGLEGTVTGTLADWEAYTYV